MGPFSALLRKLLRERGLTQKAFAQSVRRSYPFVNNVARGLRGAPDDVETWADTLQLTDAEREDFLNLAALTRAEQRVRDLIIAYERRADGDHSITVPKYLLREWDKEPGNE